MVSLPGQHLIFSIVTCDSFMENDGMKPSFDEAACASPVLVPADCLGEAA